MTKPSTTTETKATPKDYRLIKTVLITEAWNVSILVAFLIGLSVK